MEGNTEYAAIARRGHEGGCGRIDRELQGPVNGIEDKARDRYRCGSLIVQHESLHGRCANGNPAEVRVLKCNESWRPIARDGKARCRYARNRVAEAHELQASPGPLSRA